MGEVQPRIPDGNTQAVSAHPWRNAAISWTLALAMFGFLYHVAPPALKLIVGWCVGGGLATGVLFVVFTTRSNLRELRKLGAEHDQALAAMQRGEFARARDVFWRLASTTKVATIDAIARHNLAWATMRLGDLQHASELWADNESRHGTTLVRVGLAATSSVDLALCHALMGNLTAAESWLATAGPRAQDPLNRPNVPELLIFVRATIDCRARRCADAARQLDEEWARCEASLVGSTLRVMRVIRGFALAADGPRNAGLATSALANMRPVYADEFDFLGVAWPEMASFLVTNGLATRPSLKVTSDPVSAVAG
jgi:hypothetical protein